ncbi:hypothetical protein Dda_3400 [Drechslerella dactyloides]|uniref:Uncharacterized protein n=1 Tax=Drechslerella dactyloides TaxID=74499 RepID=A0AAD6J175_DREDA|nr:hypothetical protein Dda_3400 [Drechslerella dactyloides]
MPTTILAMMTVTQLPNEKTSKATAAMPTVSDCLRPTAPPMVYKPIMTMTASTSVLLKFSRGSRCHGQCNATYIPPSQRCCTCLATRWQRFKEEAMTGRVGRRMGRTVC